MGDAYEIRVPAEKAQHQNRKPSTLYVGRSNKHQFRSQKHLLEQHLYSASYALHVIQGKPIGK